MSTLPEEQAETVAFLSKASSYGLAGTIERIDTHASIVFLAGDRAFKLKRAIRYPYLDYSNVTLRRHACESELVLNRRTAPDLYLEVRPVLRNPNGSLGFGIEGEPVDWLVVMQRFGQDCLFDRMADERRLTEPLLRQLTDEIVRFHAEAEVIGEADGAEGIRSIVEGNRTSMGQVTDILHPDHAEAIYFRSRAVVDELTDLLDRRAASGHVRRCHGDLHLRNICLLGQRPTLFDCIEFNDAIACIDVLYDLAFLLMDLWHRGLRDAANATFNRYLDLTDEVDGLAAIPLFISIRAAIRAHVEASAAGMQPNAEEAQRKADLARSYLVLAEQTIRQRAPRLIAIGGVSGTGKSTLAKTIAPQLVDAPGARVLRSDILRKRIHAVAPEARLPVSAYSEETSKDVYQRLYSLARDTLNADFPVVADAVFADPAERAAIEDVAAKAGVHFSGIWLAAPVEQLERRLDERQDDASDATVAVMRRQLSYDTGPVGWTYISAGGSAAETLRNASVALGI